MSTSLQSILVVVLFGIGTDYIAFLLFRYRERIRAGATHQESLTFAATLGGVALVFLDAVGYSGIDFTIPIVLYLFAVAIGTDAPTVAAAGVILAFTFASLRLTGIANLVELGFGVAIGIAIAAFGMSPLLAPSLSVLQGRSFWWPTKVSPQRQNTPA